MSLLRKCKTKYQIKRTNSSHHGLLIIAHKLVLSLFQTLPYRISTFLYCPKCVQNIIARNSQWIYDLHKWTYTVKRLQHHPQKQISGQRRTTENNKQYCCHPSVQLSNTCHILPLVHLRSAIFHTAAVHIQYNEM